MVEDRDYVHYEDFSLELLSPKIVSDPLNVYKYNVYLCKRRFGGTPKLPPDSLQRDQTAPAIYSLINVRKTASGDWIRRAKCDVV